MIRDRTEELQRLHFEHAPREEPSSNGHKPVSGDTSRSDEEVIEKLRAERGGKSERLWNGDLSDYDGDHSSAEDAFVHKIWSYTQDPEQSVVQIEATERGADYVALRLRQKKHTFGAVSDPFGVEVTFGEGITFDVKVLDDADLAGEGTLNATDRVKLALKEEPAYPDELAEKTGLVPGTVKNALTKLRKAGEVETTGERKSGGAEQVTLLVTKSSSLSSSYRGNDDDDGDKPLSVAAIGEEISRTNSGPAKALATYLDKPTEERLKWLTCAVLTARGMDTGNWKRQVRAVREAATEAKNHPLDCECEECSI